MLRQLLLTLAVLAAVIASVHAEARAFRSSDRTLSDVRLDQVQSDRLRESLISYSENPFVSCDGSFDNDQKLAPIRRMVKEIPELRYLSLAPCEEILEFVKRADPSLRGSEEKITAASNDHFGLRVPGGRVLKVYVIPAGRTNTQELNRIFGANGRNGVRVVPVIPIAPAGVDGGR